MRPRRRALAVPAWRAWVASWALVVLAVAPLLAIFHQASVRHAVCEDGDLIEPDARAHDALGRESSASRSENALDTDSASSVHGHAHCQVGTLAKTAARAVAPAPVLGALSEEVVTPPQHRDVAPARPVL